MQGLTTHSARRRRWLLGALTVLILSAALWGGHHWPSRSEPPAPPSQPPLLQFYPVTLAPGIHLLGGLVPAAAYAVETSAGLVLIDSGLEADAGPLKGQLAALGLDWTKLHAILLTHVHADHSGGARYLREATGAKVYAGRDDALVLQAGGPPEAFFSNFHMPQATVRPTPVDVQLAGGETVAVGGARFQALGTPGHTPGSTCYLMERNGLRVLFSGDVIMSMAGSVQVDSKLSRPLGTYAAYMSPRYRGDASAFLASLRKLRALPVPDLVLPGHPRMDGAPGSPSLSQKRWEVMLTSGIRDMETLLARFGVDGTTFLDGTPRQLLPGLYYLGDFKGTAVYGFRARSKLFVVDAGGTGLAAFLNARFQALGVRPSVPSAVLLTSCGPEATAGLKDSIGASHARVVAPSAGLQHVKKLCPPGTVLLPAEELPSKGWCTVEVLPLCGRGLAPVAYRLTRDKKCVLFSGRIPIKITHAAVTALMEDFAASRGTPVDFFISLDRLIAVKPDLWLPAVPADGQNAHLYDGDWKEIIAANRRMLR